MMRDFSFSIVMYLIMIDSPNDLFINIHRILLLVNKYILLISSLFKGQMKLGIYRPNNYAGGQ